MLSRLPRRSGRAIRGFTLIELMIAVTIIGLLSAIAVPQFSLTKERAYTAAMKSDLRNFSTHEESYFYDNAIYAADIATLQSLGYQMSPDVAVTIVEATSSGWSATAEHDLSDVQCGLFVGTAAPVSAATVEGIVACQ